MEFDIEDASGGVRPEVGDGVDEPSDEGWPLRACENRCQCFSCQATRRLPWLVNAGKVRFRCHVRVVKANSTTSQTSETCIPRLVTADEIGAPLGVTGRTVLNWAEAKKIPIAFRLGKIVRFDPAAVAEALGLL